MPKGIYPRIDEHKKNMSLAHIGISNNQKGLKRSEETRKKLRETHLGQKCSEETREKIKKTLKGRVPWNKNKKLSKEHKEKTRNTMKNKNRIGERNPNYKGGITDLWSSIRNLEESQIWRKSVFQRDNYICQDCRESNNGNLNAHHKKEFSKILNEFLQIYSQFSPIEDKETLVRLAITYKPFWDINNGVTLCKKCHNLTRINFNIKKKG